MCLVLSVVESGVVLGVVSASSTGSDSSDVGSVGGVAVLPLDWLDHRVVQIHHQIFANGVFVGRLRLSCVCGVIPSRLGSAVVGSYPVILGILGYVDVWLNSHSSVLDRLVIERVVSSFANILNR